MKQGTARHCREGVESKKNGSGRGSKRSITQGGMENKSKVTASCSNLKEKFQECSKIEGVRRATNVEASGINLRMRTKQLGAANEKCGGFSIARKNRVS